MWHLKKFFWHFQSIFALILHVRRHCPVGAHDSIIGTGTRYPQLKSDTIEMQMSNVQSIHVVRPVFCMIQMGNKHHSNRCSVNRERETENGGHNYDPSDQEYCVLRSSVTYQAKQGRKPIIHTEAFYI